MSDESVTTDQPTRRCQCGHDRSWHVYDAACEHAYQLGNYRAAWWDRWCPCQRFELAEGEL